MIKKSSAPMRRSLVPTLVALLGLSCATSVCAAALNGQVLGGGAPIANSTVTLWAASSGAPKELAQARTGADGRFAITVPDAPGAGTSLYLVAQRGQPAANKAVNLTSINSRPSKSRHSMSCLRSSRRPRDRKRAKGA